jgi:hypothetical protein
VQSEARIERKQPAALGFTFSLFVALLYSLNHHKYKKLSFRAVPFFLSQPLVLLLCFG